MEIIINKKTYTLKPINFDRRVLFSECVLPYYNNNNMTIEQYTKFEKNIYSVLWEFLKDEDKKELGIKENLNKKGVIDISELGKFINWISERIKEYCAFIKINNGDNDSSTEKTETIFAFLSKHYGWTFDYMQEMDELDFLKALKEACELSKRESIDKVNIGALVGAFSSGSKQAKRKIDDINREARMEQKINEMKSGKIEKAGEFLTEDQLRGL